MTKSKKIGIVFAIIFLLLLGSWGVVYASASRLVSFAPEKSAIISDDLPTIEASWQIVPGVSLSSAEVLVDGVDVTDKITISDGGFSYTPLEPLAQGDHTVEANLSYNIAVDKNLTYNWTFTVDTEAPPLILENEDNYVVSPEVDYVLKGKSEPNAIITAKLNDKKSMRVSADSNGDFSFDLKGLDDKNELRLGTEDAVGNLRTLVLPVIKDETTPTISSLSPPNAMTVRSLTPKISVKFEEGESGIKSMKLTIDSTLAIEKVGTGEKSISYLGSLLSDGEHLARVEATDYAGRTVASEWRFIVDSRKIIINRAERRLYFYNNGGLMKVYPIAVGMPAWPTPSGNFKIYSKDPRPTWRNPGSEWGKDMPASIPPGPGNPLGTRAMGVKGSIFIHGTYSPGSLGRAASHGCIRMSIRDSEALFRMIDIGTPVKIR